MTKKDAEQLYTHASDTPHGEILRALKSQIEAYVKPYMKKIKPDILIVGPGVFYVDEAMSWATQYTYGTITVVEPDKDILASSVVLSEEIFSAPVAHGEITIAPERFVESVFNKFDVVTWRNMPTYAVPEQTIHHCLSLVADEGIAYFTSSEPTSYEDIIKAVDSYNEEGVSLERLHPTQTEFAETPHPFSPSEMRNNGTGFPDDHILSIKIHRSSQRRKA